MPIHLKKKRRKSSAAYSYRYSNRHSISCVILTLIVENTRICGQHEIHFDIQIYIRSHTPSIFPYMKKPVIYCWHETHFDIQICIRSLTPSISPYIKKTRICCWHEIHFDIHIFIRSPTLSISPYTCIIKRKYAAGMKFISIFISIFNFIDIHMPKHKNTRICCWHEIHFDIQIYIQSHRHPHAHT